MVSFRLWDRIQVIIEPRSLDIISLDWEMFLTRIPIDTLVHYNPLFESVLNSIVNTCFIIHLVIRRCFAILTDDFVYIMLYIILSMILILKSLIPLIFLSILKHYLVPNKTLIIIGRYVIYGSADTSYFLSLNIILLILKGQRSRRIIMT